MWALPGQRLRANLVWKSQASLSRYSSEITTTIRLHLRARSHIIVSCKNCESKKTERFQETRLAENWISSVRWLSISEFQMKLTLVMSGFLNHLWTFHFYISSTHTRTHTQIINQTANRSEPHPALVYAWWLRLMEFVLHLTNKCKNELQKNINKKKNPCKSVSCKLLFLCLFWTIMTYLEFQTHSWPHNVIRLINFSS